MNYDPKEANTLIPDGEYDGEIRLAEETHSKAGNQMWKLTVNVWAGGGGPRVVFDYVVVPSTLWRLKQIASALGLMAQFESGSMDPPDVMGKALRVALKTQKDKTGSFPDRNVITRYLASETAAPAGVKVGADDDIPF